MIRRSLVTISFICILIAVLGLGSELRAESNVILDWKEFQTLHLNAKKEYIKQLRRIVWELEAKQFNQLGPQSFAWIRRLLMDTAYADSVNSEGPCLYAGQFSHLEKTSSGRLVCARPKSTICNVPKPIECEPVLFGDRLCVLPGRYATRDCFSQAADPSEVASSLTDEKWKKIKQIGEYCKNPLPFQKSICAKLITVRLASLELNLEASSPESEACPLPSPNPPTSLESIREVSKALPLSCGDRALEGCVEEISNGFRNGGLWGELQTLTTLSLSVFEAFPKMAKKAFKGSVQGVVGFRTFLQKMVGNPYYRKKVAEKMVKAVALLFSKLKAKLGQTAENINCENAGDKVCQFIGSLSAEVVSSIAYVTAVGGIVKGGAMVARVAAKNPKVLKALNNALKNELEQTATARAAGFAAGEIRNPLLLDVADELDHMSEREALALEASLNNDDLTEEDETQKWSPSRTLEFNNTKLSNISLPSGYRWKENKNKNKNVYTIIGPNAKFRLLDTSHMRITSDTDGSDSDKENLKIIIHEDKIEIPFDKKESRIVYINNKSATLVKSTESVQIGQSKKEVGALYIEGEMQGGKPQDITIEIIAKPDHFEQELKKLQDILTHAQSK